MRRLQRVGLHAESLKHIVQYGFTLALACTVEAAVATQLADGRLADPKLAHRQRTIAVDIGILQKLRGGTLPGAGWWQLAASIGKYLCERAPVAFGVKHDEAVEYPPLKRFRQAPAFFFQRRHFRLKCRQSAAGKAHFPIHATAQTFKLRFLILAFGDKCGSVAAIGPQALTLRLALCHIGAVVGNCLLATHPDFVDRTARLSHSLATLCLVNTTVDFRDFRLASLKLAVRTEYVVNCRNEEIVVVGMAEIAGECGKIAHLAR